MGKIENLKGKRFGMLVVEEYKYLNKNHRAMWMCKCDCGNEKIIASHDLKHGVKSCGCLFKNNMIINKRIHNIWNNMINRCCNPNNKRYYDYGGRGIKLCSEWRNKYKNFEKWALNNGYSDDLTIDRKDNNKGYCPKNCRWITRKENSRNMRNNRFITIDGCKKTLQEWSEIYSIRPCTVATRIRRGWNEIEAVTTPVKNKKGKVLNG